MGTNNCRNMLFDGCQVTSFDAHTAAYNITLKNSTCEHLNFIGAGDILLENMTVYSDIKEAALVLRNDYGCTWNGNVTIKNLTLKSKSDSPEIDLIKAQYVNHDFGMRTYLPNTVKIDGIYVKQYSVSFDGGGNRVETVKDVFHAKIHIYKYLAGFQSDISLESSSNLNPYTPTRQLYIDNAQANITWVFPKAPQFKNMQIYIDGRYQEWRNG